MSAAPAKRAGPRSLTPYGMLLDRGLTVELLEVAFDVGAADRDLATSRRRLTIALRDHVSDQEAEGKTKKCLTRIWLNPPEDAAAMIDWARTSEVPPEARRVLHFGAILATFPFAGVVARVIGQHLRTEGEIGAAAARAEVRRLLGDRSSVDIAARKTYTTFRNLGLLNQDGQTLRLAASLPEVPPCLAAWLGHAVLLTRQADSLPASSLRAAPELLSLQLPGTQDRAYNLTEVHAQADGPTISRR